MLRKFQGENLISLAIRSLPHDLVTGGIPHAGSQQWGSQGKNTEVICHFLLQCMKVKSEREVAQACLTLRDPIHGLQCREPV